MLDHSCVSVTLHSKEVTCIFCYFFNYIYLCDFLFLPSTSLFIVYVRCLSVSLSLCLSVCLCLRPHHSLFLSLPFTLSLSLSLCLSVSVCLCLRPISLLSLSIRLSLRPYSLSLFLSEKILTILLCRLVWIVVYQSPFVLNVYFLCFYYFLLSQLVILCTTLA